MSFRLVWTPEGGAIILNGVPNVIAFTVSPTGINNSGEVSGLYGILPPTSPGPPPVYRPFVWTADTGIVDLGIFPGLNAEALATNNRGATAGTVETTGVFLWAADQGAVTLPGGTDTTVNSNYPRFLNNRSEITAVTSGGAFLWSPKTGMSALGGGCVPVALNDRSEVVGN
jgi:hypothetical protein